MDKSYLVKNISMHARSCLVGRYCVVKMIQVSFNSLYSSIVHGNGAEQTNDELVIG